MKWRTGSVAKPAARFACLPMVKLRLRLKAQQQARVRPEDVPQRHPLWEASREERKARCREDDTLFAEVYLKHRLTAPVAGFHRELLAAVEAVEQTPGAGLVAAAPRGHAKSTWMSFVHPLKKLLYREKRCIVVVSNTGFLSTALVRGVKEELEHNELIKADFGPQRGKKWTDADLETLSGGKLVARSMGSQLRGINHLGQRPDLIIGDDLENDEHVRTPEQRQKALEWWNKAVLPALDPQKGNVVVVGTLLHFDSLLAKLLAQTDVYLTKLWRTNAQECLWPEWVGPERLAFERKRLGAFAFACEYENNPIDPDTQVFRPKWWRWYTRDDCWWDAHEECWRFKGERLTIYQGIDPAISLKQAADYFAHVTIGVAPSGAILVLEAKQERIDFPTQVDRINEREAYWSPTLVGLETVGYQAALKDQVLKDHPHIPIRAIRGGDEALSYIDDPLGVSQDVTQHKRLQAAPKTQKELRINARSVLVEAGRVYLRAAAPDEEGVPEADIAPDLRIHPSIVDFVTQATQYPRAAHDDILDAWDNALACAVGARRWGMG